MHAFSRTSSGSGHGDTPSSLFGYEVIAKIGEGAGSVIYVVSHPESHQIYALKHVVCQNAKDERFVEQLEAEYEVGRAISHAGLRKSIDLKVNRTLLRKPTDAALVMELFDGQPLEAQPPKSVAGAVNAFIQVGHALDALNQAGYVHCDLKPNNILRNNAKEVKVIDLGQTCKIGTVKARIQGTPDYISPEQVKCEAVSVRTDVYNFGATLYWVLTGKNVPTLFTIKRSENSFLVDNKIPSPAELNPAVPQTLSALVMECVKVNPEKRPADMAVVTRRLEVIEFQMQRHRAATHGAHPELVRYNAAG